MTAGIMEAWRARQKTMLARVNAPRDARCPRDPRCRQLRRLSAGGAAFLRAPAAISRVPGCPIARCRRGARRPAPRSLPSSRRRREARLRLCERSLAGSGAEFAPILAQHTELILVDAAA